MSAARSGQGSDAGGTGSAAVAVAVATIFYTIFYSTGWYSVLSMVTDRYAIFEEALLSGTIWYGVGYNGT